MVIKKRRKNKKTVFRYNRKKILILTAPQLSIEISVIERGFFFYFFYSVVLNIKNLKKKCQLF